MGARPRRTRSPAREAPLDGLHRCRTRFFGRRHGLARGEGSRGAGPQNDSDLRGVAWRHEARTVASRRRRGWRSATGTSRRTVDSSVGAPGPGDRQGVARRLLRNARTLARPFAVRGVQVADLWISGGWSPAAHDAAGLRPFGGKGNAPPHPSRRKTANTEYLFAQPLSEPCGPLPRMLLNCVTKAHIASSSRTPIEIFFRGPVSQSHAPATRGPGAGAFIHTHSPRRDP
jgi:hypothetical protein